MENVVLQVMFDSSRGKGLQSILDLLGIEGDRIRMVRPKVKMSTNNYKTLYAYKILFPNDELMRDYFHELYASYLRGHILNCQIFDGELASFGRWGSNEIIKRKL